MHNCGGGHNKSAQCTCRPVLHVIVPHWHMGCATHPVLGCFYHFAMGVTCCPVAVLAMPWLRYRGTGAGTGTPATQAAANIARQLCHRPSPTLTITQPQGPTLGGCHP